MSRWLVLLLSFLLISCDTAAVGIAGLTCDDIESEAIRISEGELIKIVQSSETSRTPSQLICHGSGFFKDGTSIDVRYRAWKDEDGEIMVAWDSDEARKRVQDAENAAAEQEREAFVENTQREMREAMRQAGDYTDYEALDASRQ